MSAPYLTDPELADICAPLVTGSAQARYLARLGLKVARKPNGKPLVARAEWDRVMVGVVRSESRPGSEPNRAALMSLVANKGARHGTQATGR